MIVVHNLIDITLIIRTGKDYHFAFIANKFVELFEFIEKYKPVYNGHVDIEENDARKILRLILMLFQVVQGSFA